MPKTTTTIDQAASVSLPPEALDALGVEAGAELDVEIIGRAVVDRFGCRSPALARVHRFIRVHPGKTPRRL